MLLNVHLAAKRYFLIAGGDLELTAKSGSLSEPALLLGERRVLFGGANDIGGGAVYFVDCTGHVLIVDSLLQ